MAEESKEKKGVQPGRRTEHLVDPDKNKKAWQQKATDASGRDCWDEASPPHVERRRGLEALARRDRNEREG